MFVVSVGARKNDFSFEWPDSTKKHDPLGDYPVGSLHGPQLQTGVEKFLKRKFREK